MNRHLPPVRLHLKNWRAHEPAFAAGAPASCFRFTRGW